MACTNLIVGKKASSDGSVFCTYSADSWGMFTGLCHYPAGYHMKNERREIYDYDTNVCHGIGSYARHDHYAKNTFHTILSVFI